MRFLIWLYTMSIHLIWNYRQVFFNLIRICTYSPTHLDWPSNSRKFALTDLQIIFQFCCSYTAILKFFQMHTFIYLTVTLNVSLMFTSLLVELQLMLVKWPSKDYGVNLWTPGQCNQWAVSSLWVESHLFWEKKAFLFQFWWHFLWQPSS